MSVTVVGMSSERLRGCAMHGHTQWEIVYFLRGEGVHAVGGREIAFQAGTIICQPPRIMHGTRGAGEYQDMYMRLDDFASPNAQAVPVFQDDEEKRFQTLFLMLHESFHRREPNSANLVEALYAALCQMLVGWSVGRVEQVQVDALLREMTVNIANAQFSIARKMAESGYCDDHFRRCFKKAVGQTPTAYMIALRLRHAQGLLSQSDASRLSVKQIAAMCGFSDPYYFSTLFRRRTGMSPTEFARRERRAEWREDLCEKW